MEEETQPKQLEVKYVDWGLANNFGTHIELNKHLLKPEYKDLHDNILKHELLHSDKLFSFNDLRLDLKEAGTPSGIILKFMLKHPKSFLQMMPIYLQKGKGLVYDINLLLMFISFIVLIIITTYLSWKYI